MIREYEIVVILRPQLGDDKYKAIQDNFQKWIKEANGEVKAFTSWGNKELPETFKKFTHGYFFVCEFSGDNTTLDNLKQKMAVDESFIRHLNVRLDSIRDSRKVEATAGEEARV